MHKVLLTTNACQQKRLRKSETTFRHILVYYLRLWSHGCWIDGEEIIIFSNYLPGIIPEFWQIAFSFDNDVDWENKTNSDIIDNDGYYVIKMIQNIKRQEIQGPKEKTKEFNDKSSNEYREEH